MSAQDELAPQQIRTLVHAAFPGADLVSCQLFPGDHSNLNYDLCLDHPLMEAVLKVYTATSARRGPWKETHLLRMLTSETGVPVPRVLHFDDSSALIDHPWALHARLPGSALSGIVDLLDGQEQESVGYEMGRYLGHIHQIPLEQFGEFYEPGSDTHAGEKQYLLARIDELLAGCAAHDLLPPEIEDRVRQRFLQTQVLNRSPACLIHGDYRLHNVVVEPGRAGYHVTGVLEFECAGGGSPEHDIGELFTWDIEGRVALQKGFLDGYAESAELYAQFWKRLGFYQVLAALAGLANAHARGRPEQVQHCRRRVEQYLAVLEAK
jgi:aminoglycoside phosphotransferase (APT) family kinase protein